MLCNKCFCCIIFSLLYCTCLQFLLYGCFVWYNLLYTGYRTLDMDHSRWSMFVPAGGGMTVGHWQGPDAIAGHHWQHSHPDAGTSGAGWPFDCPNRKCWRRRTSIRALLTYTVRRWGFKLGPGKKEKAFFFEVQSLFESRWFWSRINSMAP